MKKNLSSKCIKILILASLLLQGGCSLTSRKSSSSSDTEVHTSMGQESSTNNMNDFDMYEEETFAEDNTEEEEEIDFSMQETMNEPEPMTQASSYVPASRRYPPMRPKQVRNETERSETWGDFDNEMTSGSQMEVEVATEEVEFMDYTARKGDSMWTIARKHGVSLNEMLELNGMSKDSVLRVGQKLLVPANGKNSQMASMQSNSGQEVYTSGTQTYTVRSGDSLSKIASMYRTTVRDLKMANNLSSDMIRVGQKLEVPEGMPKSTYSSTSSTTTTSGNASGTYTIRTGDTLSIIAQRHGMSTNELMQLNNISNPNKIRAGQVLNVNSTGKASMFSTTKDMGSNSMTTIEERVTSLSISSKSNMSSELNAYDDMDDMMFDDLEDTNSHSAVLMNADVNAAELDMELELDSDASFFDSNDDMELVPVEFSAS